MRKFCRHAAVGLLCGVFVLASGKLVRASDIPMTRVEERIALVEGIGSNSTFTELADGRLLLSDGGGSFRSSPDGGKTWSDAWKATGPNGESLGAGEAALIRLKGAAIGYASRAECRGLQAADQGCIVFSRSEDGGKTFSKPKLIHAPQYHEIAIFNDVLVRTSSGRIILPVYGVLGLAKDPRFERHLAFAMHRGRMIPVGAHDWDPKFTWCYVYYSDDEGETWHSSHSGEIIIYDPENMTWNRTSEPSVAEVSPGKLIMVMRTELGRLFSSWSNDNGETWTLPEPMPLASASSPAQVRKIPSTGDLVIVWSQASEKEIEGGLNRSRLSTAVSRSSGVQGKIWEFFQNIASTQEGTRVELGALRRARPLSVFTESGRDADGPYASELPDQYALTSYPSVYFYKDRMIVGHSYAHWDEKFNYINPGQIQVVPVSWLYGGPAGLKLDGFDRWWNRVFPQKQVPAPVSQ